jgi:hypothetical protein
MRLQEESDSATLIFRIRKTDPKQNLLTRCDSILKVGGMPRDEPLSKCILKVPAPDRSLSVSKSAGGPTVHVICSV